MPGCRLLRDQVLFFAFIIDRPFLLTLICGFRTLVVYLLPAIDENKL